MAFHVSRNLSRDVVQISPGSDAEDVTRAGEGEGGGHIPMSDALTGIELRVQKLIVRDNGTRWVWPFVRYSDFYVVTIAVDNLGGTPYRVALEGFKDVDDGDALPIERTVYLWQADEAAAEPPNQMHMVISVIKSKAGLRKVGELMGQVTADKAYQDALGQVISLAKWSPVGAITAGLEALTEIIGRALGAVEDSPLFTQVLSFTGLNGDFDSLGKHVHERGNRYVSLEVALTVRDAGRAVMPREGP
jgi:hypothetical protein